MRIHGWSDVEGLPFRPPPHVMKEEGSVLEFHDYPQMYDMQVGDIILYKTGLATVEFQIAEVRPADLADYPTEMTLVTAKKKDRTI